MTVASRKRTRHRGYSLGTLFLLVAACAVAIGMVAPVLRGGVRVGTEEIVEASIVTGLLALLIGALVGLFHQSRLRGVGWGVIVGGLIGLICGPIAYIPPEGFSFVFTTAVGGSLLVVCTAAAVRLSSSDRFVEDEYIDPGDGIVTAVVVQPKRHPLDPDPEDES